MAKRSRTDTMASGGLIPLSEAKGWHVRKGNPHVHGWDVVASGGTEVGEVDDLLVDLQAEKARYLIVTLDDEVAGVKHRQVAVPLGVAQIDQRNEKVVLSQVTAEQLVSLPSYQKDRFTRDTETLIRNRMGIGSAQTTDRDFYDNALFDEGRFYGTRREGTEEERRIPLAEEELAVGTRPIQAGEVDIKKTVETQHVQKQVPVTREEVEVERRPVSADHIAQAQPADIGEEEIRVPLTEEEVVVEKRPVVKEELVVKKRATESTRDVEADIKKERIDIDKRGNVRGRVEGDESTRGRDRGPSAP